MREVPYTEFTAFLGKHGWPKADYEFGKRYEVIRHVCISTFNGVTSSRSAEVHKELSRGKVTKTTYFLPA